MSRSPRDIAKLLTEDPNVMKEEPAFGRSNPGGGLPVTKTMEVDDVPIGNDEYHVVFEVEAELYPGEKKVMYYKDGSGYPGSPPSLDWHVTDIKQILGEKEVSLTPEVVEAAKDALYAHIDDDELLEELADDFEGYRDFP